jgi:sugar O-acyltransferase (sialic acid O-acetyltransferase NeuD family)
VSQQLNKQTKSSSTKIVLYGNGIFTKLVLAALAEQSLLDPIAVTADEGYIQSNKYEGLPLVAFEEIDQIYPPEQCQMLVTIGYRKLRAKKRAFEKCKAKGYMLANFISDQAVTYPDLEIGENNLIFGHAYLGPDGTIGDNTIVRPNTYIGHDFTIRDHAYVAPGVNIAGSCTIGELSFIGIGSTVIGGVVLAKETLIGSGSLVLKNTEAHGLYMGRPAKLIRKHVEHGIIIE